MMAIIFEDEILIRDLMNKVRKSSSNDKEHENRYYNFKDHIICTRCYEVSLFEGKAVVKLAKHQRLDKYKESGEELWSYVCGDHCDDLDDDEELNFDDVWEINSNPRAEEQDYDIE